MLHSLKYKYNMLKTKVMTNLIIGIFIVKKSFYLICICYPTNYIKFYEYIIIYKHYIMHGMPTTIASFAGGVSNSNKLPTLLSNKK